MVLQLDLTLATKSPMPPRESPARINNSFVLKQAGEFFYEQRKVSQLATSRHVRVRVVATGLCGSDVCCAHLNAASPAD